MTEEEIWEPDPTGGTCKHECYHRDGIVWLRNNQDEYYEETFKTPDELEIFITKLRACAYECWSKTHKENVVYSVYPAKDLSRLIPDFKIK